MELNIQNKRLSAMVLYVQINRFLYYVVIQILGQTKSHDECVKHNDTVQ